jgi:hypothetical protein
MNNLAVSLAFLRLLDCLEPGNVSRIEIPTASAKQYEKLFMDLLKESKKKPPDTR